MAYKCLLCNKNFVSKPGDICESCYKPQRNNYTDIVESKPNINQQVNMSPNTQVRDSNKGRVKNYFVGSYCGRVQNISQWVDGASVVERYFNSLFRGCAFSTKKKGYSFSLELTNDGIGKAGLYNTSIFVHAYGDLLSSGLANGQSVEVHGKRGGDGSIYAEKISNRTTNYTVRTRGTISANVIRMISLAIIAIIIFIGFMIGKGVKNFDTGIEESAANMPAFEMNFRILLCIIADAFIFVQCKKRRIPLKIILGILLVVSFLISPHVLVLIIGIIVAIYVGKVLMTGKW